MGVETLSSYGLAANTAKTATLDDLANRGMRFNNFWAQPVCSPTRATILTGRYGFRTGVGGPTGDNEQRGVMPEPPPVPAGVVEIVRQPGIFARQTGARWGITLDEFTLPQAFNARPDLGYAKAAIGKWHLSDTRNGWENHPNLAGFDHFSGLVRCCPESYFAWVQLVNGEFSTRTGYAVSDKVDDSIAWLDQQDDDTPWLLWLAFNTPHTPLHLPPRELLQSDFSGRSDDELEADGIGLFKAMIEAMDTEIGRLLAHIGEEMLENTYVIFLGDNGTGSGVVEAPFRRGEAKGSVYNGGVNVPLIVAGPGVASGAASDALVNSTDLYAAILEMAGIDFETVVPEGVTLDTVSFVPYLSDPSMPSIREWIYADAFTTEYGVESGEYAMRNARYKLLVDEGVEHFFDLAVDPYEHNDLLTGELTAEQGAELEALRTRIRELHASER
jgi:arylsulfatase A-like enzyme